MATKFSNQYNDAFQTVPQQMVKSSDWGSKMRTSYAKYDAAVGGQAVDGDTIKLMRIPAGRVRVYGRNSSQLWTGIPFPAAPTATIVIGHAAYTDADGVAKTAVTNSLAASAILGTGTAAVASKELDAVIVEYNSQAGVDITATVGGTTVGATGTGVMELVLSYQIGN